MIRCDINKVIISGYTVSETNLCYTTGGTAVMNFSLESRGLKYTERVEITVWGELAERVTPGLKKGMHIMVEGSIHRRLNREGEPGAVEINASRIFSMEDNREIY